MRTYTPAADHCFLVSFPKSGNTWLRFLLANYFADREEPITFAEVGSIVPDLHGDRDRAALLDADSPFTAAPGHFIQSHTAALASLPRVVYLVRDGRDVIASYYHWATARIEEPVRLSDLIQGRAIPTGLWCHHVLGWLTMQHPARLVLRYRELLADPAAGLTRALTFAGVDVDPDRVARAVEHSDLDAPGARALPSDLSDGPQVDPDLPGAWRRLFTDADHALFWQVHGEAMRAAGFGETMAAAG